MRPRPLSVFPNTPCSVCCCEANCCTACCLGAKQKRGDSEKLHRSQAGQRAWCLLYEWRKTAASWKKSCYWPLWSLSLSLSLSLALSLSLSLSLTFCHYNYLLSSHLHLQDLSIHPSLVSFCSFVHLLLLISSTSSSSLHLCFFISLFFLLMISLLPFLLTSTSIPPFSLSLQSVHPQVSLQHTGSYGTRACRD